MPFCHIFHKMALRQIGTRPLVGAARLSQLLELEAERASDAAPAINLQVRQMSLAGLEDCIDVFIRGTSPLQRSRMCRWPPSQDRRSTNPGPSALNCEIGWRAPRRAYGPPWTRDTDRAPVGVGEDQGSATQSSLSSTSLLTSLLRLQ